MSCTYEIAGDGKIAVTLTFKRDELLYDIRNMAYVEGHVMSTDNEEARHTLTDIGEAGNVDRVTRMLDLCVAGCTEMLYPFTKRSVVETVLDDTLKETPVYKIEMSVPGAFSQTTAEWLERLIHEYLVCRALADWMSVANTEKAGAWLEKADAAESEIRSALAARMTRTRIRQHWLA